MSITNKIALKILAILNDLEREHSGGFFDEDKIIASLKTPVVEDEIKIILEDFEKEGLIERAPKTDKEFWLVKITPKGVNALWDIADSDEAQ